MRKLVLKTCVFKKEVGYKKNCTRQFELKVRRSMEIGMKNKNTCELEGMIVEKDKLD